jgi:signal transduction histidine kinase
MRTEEIQIRELIEDCIHSRGTMPENSDISLEMDLDDPQAVLRGDRRLLRTAMSNLIHTSIGHAKPGGKVTIGHKRDSMRESIEVSNDGNGIPYEELRSVRDLFSRSSMRTVDDADEIEPALVRLSIVRDVADLHRGRVGVRSMEGCGSTFTLHLPRCCA